MIFLVELAMWLILPILLGWGAGLPAHLKTAARGLFYPAMNQQIGRLQFIARLALIALPVMFALSVVLGAWFREWRGGAIGMLCLAATAYGAAWCGQRIERMVKQLQVIKHESIEVEQHD